MIEVHDRPLITFALFAYNQEKYIREAVEGAFAQTYSPLEIILSDDCSTDGTFEIMKAMAASYRGPHRVVLNRNPSNLGICPHIDVVMEMAQGQLIVPAAGDDISLPNRAETTHAVWAKCSWPDYLFFGIEVFSDHGKMSRRFVFNPETATPRGMIEHYGGLTLLAPAEAWHRRLFDVFGPLPPGVMTEDKSIAFRAALLGGVVYVSYPLVRYRLHDGNISRQHRHDRQGRRAARVRTIHWLQARLTGYAHDLDIALTHRLLDEDQRAVFQEAIDGARQRLEWELAIVEGSMLARLRAGLALWSMGAPSGGGKWCHLATWLWQAIRGI